MQLVGCKLTDRIEDDMLTMISHHMVSTYETTAKMAQSEYVAHQKWTQLKVERLLKSTEIALELNVSFDVLLPETKLISLEISSGANPQDNRTDWL